MFMKYVSFIGAFWGIRLIDGVHVVNYIHNIRGGFPPWITSHLFPIFETLIGNVWIATSSFLDLSMSSDKAQGPIYYFGP